MRFTGLAVLLVACGPPTSAATRYASHWQVAQLQNGYVGKSVRSDGSGALYVYATKPRDPTATPLLLRSPKWSAAFAPITPSSTFCPTDIAATDGQIVVASNEASPVLYRSTDGGETFTAEVSATLELNGLLAATSSTITTVRQSDSPNVVAVTRDGGSSWKTATMPASAEGLNVGAASALVAGSTLVLSSLDDASTAWPALLEHDGSITWRGDDTMRGFQLEGGWATNATHVYLTGSADEGRVPFSFYSVDGGTTFAPSSLPTSDASIAEGAGNASEQLLVGAAGTLLYSSDGGQTYAHVGPTGTTNYVSVAVGPNGEVAVLGDDGSLLLHDDLM